MAQVAFISRLGVTLWRCRLRQQAVLADDDAIIAYSPISLPAYGNGRTAKAVQGRSKAVAALPIYR